MVVMTGSSGLMVKVAEGVGSAPTSVVTDPVFETGAASFYLPAFLKCGIRNAECGMTEVQRAAIPHSTLHTPHFAFRMAARVGLAPTPNGLTGRRATLTLPGNSQLALPAGLPPASFRLEGGCLMYSTTAAIRRWSERQDFHLRPPGPKPGALKTELRSDKNGGSEGVRTLSLPADNGLLR